MNRLIEKMVFFGFSTICCLGAVADQHFSRLIKVNDRRYELASVRPGQDARHSIFDDGDQAVGCSEIDSDDF